MSRPFLKLDEKLIEELAALNCTVNEIAAVCKCSNDTLERNYMEAIEAGRLRGKSSLRRAQWAAAKEGNPTMLIWLGKQLLGQRDFKLELETIPDSVLAAEIERRMKLGLKSA